jgi:uncharacterized membrane protein
MEARAKLLGHPIHQMLVVFPLGLLATSFFFDIGYLITKRAELPVVSKWMIVAGVIGGLLAAVFGLIDFLGIPGDTRARRIGLLHGAGNVVVVVLFIGSFLLRRHQHDVPTMAFLLSAIAVGIALVTGWLGGELVDRLGVGVDDGANVNAPNSITNKRVA